MLKYDISHEQRNSLSEKMMASSIVNPLMARTSSILAAAMTRVGMP